MTISESIKTVTGEPVPGFPMGFTWHTGDWERIFDRQIRLIKSDIARARAQDKLIVYLSCPISARGGGYHGANIDIAEFTERRLMAKWGERFWILNPCQYQLESKEGTGLMEQHAADLGINLDALRRSASPSGGDYMRMWTKVLVEDGGPDGDAWRNTGRNFDAYYFLGPSDVHEFFSNGQSTTLTSGIEQYFSRKLATDPDFRDYYSVPGIEWQPKLPASLEEAATQAALRGQWEATRKQFFRFYAVRASAAFGLGSHDEWNIFVLLNRRRRAASINDALRGGDTGEQIAGYFEGLQIAPPATEATISAGYTV